MPGTAAPTPAHCGLFLHTPHTELPNLEATPGIPRDPGLASSGALAPPERKGGKGAAPSPCPGGWLLVVVVVRGAVEVPGFGAGNKCANFVSKGGRERPKLFEGRRRPLRGLAQPEWHSGLGFSPRHATFSPPQSASAGAHSLTSKMASVEGLRVLGPPGELWLAFVPGSAWHTVDLGPD